MRKILGAAALGCGIVFGAWGAAVDEQVLPSQGPLRGSTMQRLLLLDAARAGGRIVAVGARGYVVVSADQGVTWARAKSPEAPLLTAVKFVDAKDGWAVGHDSVILATHDGGESWTQQFSAPSEQRPLMDVVFLSRETGIAVGAYGAYYETADGGRSWNARKIIPDDKHLNAIVQVDAGKLLIVGEAGTVLVSDDAGKTWSPVASPYKGSLFGAVVAADGAVVAFGLRGHILRSTDAGRSWSAVDNASDATLMGGSRLPGGAIVLAGAAGTALVSRDDGRSFVALPTGTTHALAMAMLGAPNKVLLLGEAGPLEVPLPLERRPAARP